MWSSSIVAYNTSASLQPPRSQTQSRPRAATALPEVHDSLQELQAFQEGLKAQSSNGEAKNPWHRHVWAMLAGGSVLLGGTVLAASLAFAHRSQTAPLNVVRSKEFVDVSRVREEAKELKDLFEGAVFASSRGEQKLLMSKAKAFFNELETLLNSPGLLHPNGPEYPRELAGYVKDLILPIYAQFHPTTIKKPDELRRVANLLYATYCLDKKGNIARAAENEVEQDKHSNFIGLFHLLNEKYNLYDARFLSQKLVDLFHTSFVNQVSLEGKETLTPAEMKHIPKEALAKWVEALAVVERHYTYTSRLATAAVPTDTQNMPFEVRFTHLMKGLRALHQQPQVNTQDFVKQISAVFTPLDLAIDKTMHASHSAYIQQVASIISKNLITTADA